MLEPRFSSEIKIFDQIYIIMVSEEKATKLREPIVAVLGHVDHGKTTLLDWIRKTTIAKKEAGGITQHIGATEVPIEAIEKICGKLLKKLKAKIRLRGLLFIDTPGHEAFTNLRRRGGSIADIAILVVDINEGVMPQTREAINILKQFKVPFVIAANKVDKIHGWNLSLGVNEQMEHTKAEFYNKIYRLIGQISELGFDSDLYFNITDFTRTVAVIPISAKTGYGVAELLMVLLGLTQQYMKDKLVIDPNSPAKGTILEVKEEKGLGTTIDVIIYDGVLRKNDSIVVGSKDEPIVTKIKALLKPKPLDEMRDPRDKFIMAEEVVAASGVKIIAPNLEKALAGAPVYAGDESLAKKVKEEIASIEIDTDKLGIIVKADTLGSLEALIGILREKGIPIRKATIGNVSVSDISEAEVVKKENKYYGVIMAFNSKILKEAEQLAKDKKIKIFSSNVIYKLTEDYEEWVKREKEKEKEELLKKVVTPAKIRLLPNYVFRQSNPAIVGIEVLAGTLTKQTRLLRSDGKVVGRVKDIQLNRESIPKAEAGMRVAIAIEGVTIGRQIDEGDIVYTFLSDEDIELLSKKELSEDESKLLEEIKQIKLRAEKR